ncbi:MAG TPA: hypothetical protein VGI70_13270, partial [Polyangiales bacterium]
PIPRVQRPEFLRGEPIVSALAQAVSQALRRDRQQRFGSYDDFLNALDAAGEPAGRTNVAEWVERSLPGTTSASPAIASTISLSAPFSEGPLLRSVPLQLTAASEGAAPIESEQDEEHELTREQPKRTSADRLWPANAAWIPDAASPQTPFPVGDLEREPVGSSDRRLWTWGLALAACVGLGLLSWQMTRGTPERTAATIAQPSPPPPVPPPSAAGRARVERPTSEVARPIATDMDERVPATLPPAPVSPARKVIKAPPRRAVTHRVTPPPSAAPTESAPFIPSDI